MPRPRTIVVSTVHDHTHGLWCPIHALPHLHQVRVWFLWPSGVSGPVTAHGCDDD